MHETIRKYLAGNKNAGTHTRLKVAIKKATGMSPEKDEMYDWLSLLPDVQLGMLPQMDELFFARVGDAELARILKGPPSYLDDPTGKIRSSYRRFIEKNGLVRKPIGKCKMPIYFHATYVTKKGKGKETAQNLALARELETLINDPNTDKALVKKMMPVVKRMFKISGF